MIYLELDIEDFSFAKEKINDLMVISNDQKSTTY